MRRQTLINALLDRAADHGYPSCIPGPWCLRVPLGCPPCIKEIPGELRELAEGLWGDDPRGQPRQETPLEDLLREV